MAKLNDIRALAESHAAEISRSTRTWTGYLDTAATLYRYDFPETLLIHAQRPDATACAELEIWNSRMGRWVNRGSKGIALIDDSGPRKRLRYVFDISDTQMVRGGKTPYIWQMEPEIRQEMAGCLMDTYGLEYDPDAPLSSVLMALARAQVKDSLEDAMDGLAYEVRGTYLEGLGEDAVRKKPANPPETAPIQAVNSRPASPVRPLPPPNAEKNASVGAAKAPDSPKPKKTVKKRRKGVVPLKKRKSVLERLERYKRKIAAKYGQP